MRTSLAAAAVALLCACDGLLFAEVQIPDLQVTLPAQSFPAVDASLPPNWCDPALQSDPPCLALITDYDIGAQVPAFTEEAVSYELRMTRVAITLSANQAPGGPPDLSGVERATIRVLDDPLDPTSGLVIASYVKPPGATPTEIAVSGNANLDLGPYLVVGHLPIRVEVVVSNGTPAFDADITAGFSVVVNVDWGSYL